MNLPKFGTRVFDGFSYVIPLTKTTAAPNVVAHIYHSVRGLYFLAVVFAAIIYALRTSHDSGARLYSPLW